MALLTGGGLLQYGWCRAGGRVGVGGRCGGGSTGVGDHIVQDGGQEVVVVGLVHVGIVRVSGNVPQLGHLWRQGIGLDNLENVIYEWAGRVNVSMT